MQGQMNYYFQQYQFKCVFNRDKAKADKKKWDEAEKGNRIYHLPHEEQIGFADFVVTSMFRDHPEFHFPLCETLCFATSDLEKPSTSQFGAIALACDYATDEQKKILEDYMTNVQKLYPLDNQ